MAREEPAIHLEPDIILTGETSVRVRHLELEGYLHIFFNKTANAWEVNYDKAGTHQRTRFCSEEEIKQ